MDSAGNEACRRCKKLVRYTAEPFCGKCGVSLSDKSEVFCEECKVKKHSFDFALSVFEYTDEIKKSIFEFKFSNRRVNAEFYADAAVRLYGRLLRQKNIDLVIPVPVHKSRKMQRGYNQAEVFARLFSEKMGLECCNDFLIKQENTQEQKKLSESIRRINLKKAYKINLKRARRLKSVLLVDDIFTTGSTADACSEILKKAGIERVYVLCISRAGSGLSADLG